MKKILFVFMMLPVFVFADTCSTVLDNQTTDTRTITCDMNERTTSLYKTNKEEVVLSNSVCKITCSEEILVSIDPVKKVLAGTSFNYPLYTSGERKCTAVYDYKSYETKIKSLVNEYQNLTGNAKTTKGNEITNYYTQKKECDEFVMKDGEYKNKYEFSGDVELKLETSERVLTVPYKFNEIDEYESIVINDDAPYYNACNYNETTRKCDGEDSTLAGWTETARIFGKYTMNDTYLEKYTGEVKTSESEDTCNAKDRYFVPMNELTRPTKNDTNDNGYSLTLVAKNIGNNLVSTGQKWNLNVNCWYQVLNLMFPQSTTGKYDEKHDELGNTGFMYRLIDLNDPFPNRTAGANWIGKESIITSTKDIISSLSKFEINLNSSSINSIRSYNEVNGYEPFNIELKEIYDDEGKPTGKYTEYSSFVLGFNNVIDRK